MGRRPYSDRRTVEGCKAISTKFLNKHRYFSGGVHRGEMSWSRCGNKTGSISFAISTVDGDEYVRLQYTHINQYTGEETGMDFKVRLVSTPCYFGGRRWWFRCPMVGQGGDCKCRVGALYLGGGKYFGCRHCYNLIYESSKESHKFDDLFKRLGVTPKLKRRLFKSR